MRPFVDFYRANRISPVAQDIADRQRHFDRREALYRHLGLVPGLIAGRHVLEFGPGSGHNALHTLSLAPARYVLVDGNPTGLQRCRALLGAEPGAAAIEYVESLIEAYPGNAGFDLVLCEGVIPFQLDPPAFLRQVAGAVRPGGMVIATCADAVSVLPEILRKLMARLIVAGNAPAERQLAALRPVFKPHVATLGAMSRSPDDWILDQLIQPWVGRLLSMRDAIAALDPAFELHGSSPRFIADWRWYKAIHGPERRWNEVALQGYLANLHSLIDHRTTFPPRDPAANAALLDAAERLYDQVSGIDRGVAAATAGAAALDRLLPIRAAVAAFAPAIGAAIDEATAAIRALLAGSAAPAMPAGQFAPWFGRGQQYVSFIRR